MPVTVAELIKTMEDLAPPGLAETWDNVGLQVGDPAQTVNRILVSLDVDEKVIDEAINKKANLIISHHPLIFHPLKNLLYNQPIGKALKKLIKHNISVFSAHTNLDIVPGGINDLLADLLKLEEAEVLAPTKVVADVYSTSLEGTKYGLGRVGKLPQPVSLRELIQRVKIVLNVNEIRVVGDPDLMISRVAVCGGGGMTYLSQAKSRGADCLVTGDLKYHEGQSAEAQGIAVIDAGHYATEVIFVPQLVCLLKNTLEQANLDILASQINTNPWRLY